MVVAVTGLFLPHMTGIIFNRGYPILHLGWYIMVETIRQERSVNSSLIGATVTDSAGREIARVSDVYLDVFTLKLAGFMVVYGFYEEQEYVPIGQVLSIHSGNITLRNQPFWSLSGKAVYDASGKQIGKVKEVEPWIQDWDSLIIHRGVFKGDMHIQRAEVSRIGDDIHLAET